MRKMVNNAVSHVPHLNRASATYCFTFPNSTLINIVRIYVFYNINTALNFNSWQGL